ncbi:MAG: Hsp20/alpha crystallin family protein [Gallionellaceae bacterium]
MANITRFDPLNLARFEPFLDVNDFFKGLGVRPFMRDFQPEPQMKMDVSEADGSYLVKAEIPGVNKNDIHVSIDGNLVSISAEVKREKEEKEGESVIRSERYFGKVERSFTLANEVDSDKVQAKYSDGLLELNMPKKANGSKKSITVS